MTSKEKYKAHIRGLLENWIRTLEESEVASDPEVGKVIKAMLTEKVGQDVPEVVGD